MPIHGRFTIIAVEKERPSAKHPLNSLSPAEKAALLVLRPHSNRTSTPAVSGAVSGAVPGSGTAPNEGFLREVDEALREQEMLDAAKRYGKLVALAIVALLVALAGYLIWDSRSTAAQGERGEQLTIALDEVETGKLDPAKASLAALADNGSGGSQSAARLMQAGVLAEQGKTVEAQKLFAAVAADGDAPQAFRDLATVREVSLGFDTMPADQVVARLKPLAVPGKAFFGSAGEILGFAYLKQARPDLAGPLFAAIARDKTLPQSLQRRVRQMAGLLGVDAVDDVNEAARSGPGGQPAAPAAQPAQAAQ